MSQDADASEDASTDQDDASAPDAPVADADAEASIPQGVVQLSDGSCFIKGVTSDGHLVFERNADLMVWPESGTAAVMAGSNWDISYDMELVRGRFLGMWRGPDVLTQTLWVWSKAGGLETIAVPTIGNRLYARPESDEYAYWLKTSNPLQADVYATKAGQGKGVRVVAKLDTGVVTSECVSRTAYSNDDLLVAGCPDGGTTPRVAGYKLDGTGQSRLILDGSAPGMWLNHARSQVLVQTASASSLRSLVDSSAPLALDIPVSQAAFSADDATVLYLDNAGKLKRADAKNPAAPAALASALSILGMSSDAHYAMFATKGVPADKQTDLVLIDTTVASPTPVSLAAEKASLVGFSNDGAYAVYRATPQYPVNGADELFVVATAGGAPQKISDRADRPLFDGAVVYWFEFDVSVKKAFVKAVRLSALSNVIEVANGLDIPTAHAVVSGKHLYVASKLGLWDYPALSP